MKSTKDNSGRIARYTTAPEPWVGVSCEYDEQFTEAFKEQVALKAWDRRSYTWWFPRSYEPFVSVLLREHHMVRGEAGEHLFKASQSSLYLQKGDAAAPDDYAILGLHPSAPVEVVEMVMAYWRQRFTAFGAPSTVLGQMEAAYNRIFSNKGEGG